MFWKLFGRMCKIRNVFFSFMFRTGFIIYSESSLTKFGLWSNVLTNALMVVIVQKKSKQTNKNIPDNIFQNSVPCYYLFVLWWEHIPLLIVKIDCYCLQQKPSISTPILPIVQLSHSHWVFLTVYFSTYPRCEACVLLYPHSFPRLARSLSFSLTHRHTHICTALWIKGAILNKHAAFRE